MYKIYLKQNNEKLKSKAWIIAAPFSGSFFELCICQDVSEREPVCACLSHRCHPERTEADLLPSVPNEQTAEPQPTPYISTRDIMAFLILCARRTGLCEYCIRCLYMTICCLTPCLEAEGVLNLVSVSCSFAPFCSGIMSLRWDEPRLSGSKIIARFRVRIVKKAEGGGVLLKTLFI